MSGNIERELGAISATLGHIKEAQEVQGETLASLDERLRKVEVKSAINGAVSGGIVALTIGFIRNSFNA